MSLLLDGTNGLSDVDGTAATPAIRGTDANTGISFGTDMVTISTGGVARVTTDASGNVGIGTSSPGAKLDIVNGSILLSNTYALAWKDSGGTARQILQYFSDNSLYIDAPNGSTVFRNGASNTEKMRIDSSGNLLVGTTTQRGAGKICFDINGSVSAGIVSYPVTNSGIDAFRFLNNAGTQVGVISSSPTGTTYTTTSDYRLKENVTPMTGALEKVAALKPVTYTWKADGSAGQGFIAHELQAVVPDCVTGAKDAVETVDDLDAEGRKIGTKEVPRYQGVDTSFLVATLVAAIQEQQATISAMETRLAALEA
jgi:hypothetical protein